MEVKGDFINYGSYVDVHDNDHVTLNVSGHEVKRGAEEPAPAAKKAIMDYIGRLAPLVCAAWREHYLQLWSDVLEADVVREKVYDRGKQQGTAFNRNLVAQIAHLMVDYDVYDHVRATPTTMAEMLEPQKGKDHPVRQALGEAPEKSVKAVVMQIIEERKKKVAP